MYTEVFMLHQNFSYISTLYLYFNFMFSFRHHHTPLLLFFFHPLIEILIFSSFIL